MDIRLDSDVIARGGDKVGTVDRIVIHPDTLAIEALIVEEGMLFTTDRIIEPEMTTEPCI
jgi:sporulation protein YlmC with PRC-barrel domain